MSRSLTIVGLSFAIFLPAMILAATTEPDDHGVIVKLWPNLPPATSPSEDRIETHPDIDGKTKLRAMYNVTHPELEIFPAPADNNSGVAVIICPGGGSVKLDVDKEGYRVAAWMNAHGITGIILKYRLPHGEAAHGVAPLPIQDARRAVRMVRLHAVEWKIDPKRIGMIGFSSGGFITATVETHDDVGNPQAADPIERLSCRPDFAVLVYTRVSSRPVPAETSPSTQPSNYLGPSPSQALIDEYSDELHVSAKTPPTFIVQASDDPRVKPLNSVVFYEALLKNKVPCELHLFATGSHGFAMEIRGGEPTQWPNLLMGWLKAEKFITQ